MRARARVARLSLALTAVAALATFAPSPVTAASGPADANGSTSVSALPDPGDTGPDDVSDVEYNLGDTAYTPPALGHPVEVRASVHYPTALSGTYPLVVLMHGRHATCYEGSQAYLEWPCTGGTQMIPSYQGYDYLASNLASWGYVVVSISADGINAFDNETADGGALARAQLIQRHLNLWKKFDTTGAAPFGQLFVGRVDLQNIGEMGHSRGGEGVVESYLYNKSLGSPYGIKAVFALAPIDFNRHVPSDVAFSVLLPYCDGDVSDNQGVHFFDDSLYDDPTDDTPKSSIEVLGANHNYFNTIWTPGGWPAGTSDDWGGGSDPICGSQSGSERLSAAHQKQVGLDYINAFFRLYVGGETAFEPYFDGTEVQPKSIRFADVHDAYSAGADQRLTVNNWMGSTALRKDRLGGKVTRKGLTPFDLCGGNPPEPPMCVSAGPSQQPHTVESVYSGRAGLSQLRFSWSKTSAQMSNEIPSADADVSSYAVVSFRIAQNITASHPTEDASLQLRDASGATSSVVVSAYSDALFQQRGTTSGYTPKLILNTVRIPLSAFTGVDLTRITSVTLKLNQTRRGSVLMTDLAFND